MSTLALVTKVAHFCFCLVRIKNAVAQMKVQESLERLLLAALAHNEKS